MGQESEAEQPARVVTGVDKLEAPWVLDAFEAYAQLVREDHVGSETRAAILEGWSDEALGVFHLDGGRLGRLDPTRRLSFQLCTYLKEESVKTAEDLLPALLAELERTRDEEDWSLWVGLLKLYLRDERLIAAARSYFDAMWVDADGQAGLPGQPAKWAEILCAMAIRARADARALDEHAKLAALEARRSEILGLLLGLLDREWFEPTKATSLLLLLSAGYSFEELSPHLAGILAGGNGPAAWGVVEALRAFAAREEIGPAVLVETIPMGLYYSDFAALRLAAIELVATFGAERGAALLMSLLQDPAADREAVLENLALVGRIDVQSVLEFMSQEEFAPSCVRALGTLVAFFPDQAYPELRSLAHGAPDRVLRLEAVRAMGRTRLAGYEDELASVARLDPDPSIRASAVYGIGQSEAMQGELLASFAKSDLNDMVRGVAYQQWMLDTDTPGLVDVFDALYHDSNESFQEQGYLLLGALAHGTLANPALADVEWAQEVRARWKDELLEHPPASLLKHADWIPDGAVDLAPGAMLSGMDAVSSALGGKTLSERIDEGIDEALSAFASQETRDELELWSAIYAGSKETGRPLEGLGASLELPTRVLELLGVGSR